jgi:DNA-binding transcriptional ArsR family regulator
MLNSLLAELGEIGAKCKFIDSEALMAPGVRPDAVMDISIGTVTGRFLIEQRHRAPYASEISRLRALREIFAEQGEPTLSAPFIHYALGESLTRSGWSWVDDQGNFDLRARGLVLRQRKSTEAPRAAYNQLPHGRGGLAIIRRLIFSQTDNKATNVASLAAQANVSQPRASQVLRQLEDLNLLDRKNKSGWRVDKAALIDSFLAEYPGPGGSERYFYTLDSPVDFSIRTSQRIAPDLFAVSADVGPDFIAPWRSPSLVVIYGASKFSTNDLGLVEAVGRHDSNVIFRTPKDTSVFPSPPYLGALAGASIPLADPTQMLWDLTQLGGDDRLEAADHLREWLLRSQ